jgi:hypothetical protein
MRLPTVSSRSAALSGRVPCRSLWSFRTSARAALRVACATLEFLIEDGWESKQGCFSWRCCRPLGRRLGIRRVLARRNRCSSALRTARSSARSVSPATYWRSSETARMSGGPLRTSTGCRAGLPDLVLDLGGSPGWAWREGHRGDGDRAAQRREHHIVLVFRPTSRGHELIVTNQRWEGSGTIETDSMRATLLRSARYRFDGGKYKPAGSRPNTSPSSCFIQALSTAVRP